MKFLPNNFTKMYKFWIKTVVLYPKMYIWSRKTKIFVLFTLKMKFLPKIDQNLPILDKNRSFVPKNLHLVPKNGKNCTFYNKNEVFAKKFHQNVQILDKKCSFVSKNVYLVPKKKFVLFTLKLKFLPKNFTKMYKDCIKTVVLYPKMYIWSENQKFFTFYTKNEVFAKIFH